MFSNLFRKKTACSKSWVSLGFACIFYKTKICAVLCAYGLALISCTADKERLSGKRVSVFSSASGTAASGEKIVLARPYVNESWNSPSGNPANNKGHLAGRKSFSEKFRRDVGVNYETSPILYPPVADGKTIFTIDGNLHISAIDSETGLRLWHHTGLSNGDYIRFGALALSGGSLFAIANDSTLLRLDPKTGREIYRRNFGATLKSGLQACGDLLLFASDDGELFAVEAESGEKKFGHRTIEEPFGLIRGSTPACAGNRIVAAFTNGEVHMVMDGAPIWLASTTRSDFKSVNAMSDIAAGPVIESGSAIVKNYSGRTVAFDLKAGRELWAKSSGGMATPAASGGFLFDVDSDNVASAYGAKTGKTIWSTKLEPEKGARVLSPLLVNNQLLAAFSSGELIKLDPYTGKLISSENIAPQIDATPIVVGDVLVIISNGNLKIFR